MPNGRASVRRPDAGSGHWAAVGGLLAVLLLLGVYNDAVIAFLTAGWERALAAAGLLHQAADLQHGINGGVTKRLLPAAITYAVLYLSTCLLLLRLLLPLPAQWRLVVRLYAGALVVYVVLTLLAKFLHDADWAYRLSRHVLDFVVSPLPVAGLYVLFRAGYGPQPPSPVD